MSTPDLTPRIPSAPPVARLDREAAMCRPCEGCGAAAGEPCMPLSTCDAV